VPIDGREYQGVGGDVETTTAAGGDEVTDLTGQTFGRWSVVRRGETRTREYPDKVRRYSFWVCRCECGKVREVAQDLLKQGRSTSCGCYHAELTSRLSTGMQNHQRGEDYDPWAPAKLLDHTPLHKCRVEGLPFESVICNPMGGWEEAS
jgi:hypothetical protein